MGRDRTTKYDNFLTVSFPPMIMDLINQHSWETGISRQDFIRQCVRNMLTTKYEKDIELVIIDKLKLKNNEKNNTLDPKLV
jgi:hypothetical protein